MDKPKVLIIDDEQDLCKLFERILTDDGYSVITAYNGIDGIKRNEEHHPDIIILDLKMPKIDGIETLRNIRKTDKDVIVIVLTGYGSVETIRNSVDLNVYEYISKPFNTDVIKKVIKEAFDSKVIKNE